MTERCYCGHPDCCRPHDDVVLCPVCPKTGPANADCELCGGAGEGFASQFAEPSEYTPTEEDWQDYAAWSDAVDATLPLAEVV